MLKLILTSTLALFVNHAFSQFYVLGTVREAKSNHPLEGATVQAVEARRLAVTDAFGRFQMKLPAGEYSLHIRFLGYKDIYQTVNVKGDLTLNLQMEETAFITDEVVVSATRANEKTPSTFTNISKQDIRKQNFGQDLPYLLNWTPSLVVTSDAGTGVGYTGVRIRGSDATRINVTINGIPYNDSESLGTFWVDIPDMASSTESIQVQRGVGTSTNGAGAFGASINLQTNTRNDQPYGELIHAGGSFGTHRHTLGFGTGLINNHWVIDGRVSKIASDGFIDRASADLSSHYFSAGFYSGNTMLKAIVFGGKERTYQSWYGVPESRLKNDTEAMLTTAMNEAWNEDQINNLLTSNSRTFNIYTYDNQVDDYQQDHYQLHFSHRLNTHLTFNTSLHYTYGRGFYEEFRYDERISRYGLPDVMIGDELVTRTDIIRRRWLDNHFYGITYSLNYEKGKSNTTLGGGWNRYEGDHFGEILWSQITVAPHEYRYYFNRGDKRDFNIFLKTHYSITERLSAFADLQFRLINYEVNGIENRQNPVDVRVDYPFFNPKAGFTYSINDQQQAYFSYSIAHREPVRRDFIDNPGNFPQHESLHDMEAGYRITTDRYRLNLNYYHMRYRDQLVLTGAVNDVGASVHTNVDRSYRSGIELEGRLIISKNLTWNANVTLSQNKIKSFTETLYDYGADWDEYNVVERTFSNTDISFSPRVVAASGLTFQPVQGAEITLLTKYVGKQYLDNTSHENRRLDALLINDLRIGYIWQPSFVKEIGFSVLMNNLFNELYESNGYTWGYLGGGDEFRENYFYPQAGRNFMAMVVIKF